jgi:hypothetical protein
MSEIRIKSFSDLQKEVSQLRLAGGWSFRGQTDASWKLLPKAGRRNFIKTKDEDAIDDEDAFAYWKFCAIEHLNSIPGDDWEWLAVAQHHGLMTRLLDWSYNPLVAAFFAVREKLDADALLAAVKFENHDRPQECDPMSFQGVGRFAPRHVISRIARQSGVFTIHGPPTIAIDEGGTDYEFRRLVIAREYRDELLRDLEHFYIHQAALFPDLDGLAAYVNWKFENQINWYHRKVRSQRNNTRLKVDGVKAAT